MGKVKQRNSLLQKVVDCANTMMNPLTIFKQMLSISVFVSASVVVAFFHTLTLPLLLIGKVDLQRKLVGFFTHLHWGIVVGYSEWIGDYKLNLIADEETLATVNKQHSLWMLNHRYQVDWIALQMIGNYYGMIQNMKGVGKHSLLCLPIVGWTLYYNEFILVKRNFAQDKHIIERSMEALSTHKDPFALIVFCEGTRFTREKHEASVEFARKNNYSVLKHHLLPRTKGFHVLSQGMKSFVPRVFCATVCYQGNRDPTLVDLLNLKPIRGDMIIRSYPMDQIPSDEKECGDFVRKIYQEKDEMIDYYKANGKFPLKTQEDLKDYKTIPITRGYGSLLILVGWVVYFVLFGYIVNVYVDIAPIMYGVAGVMVVATIGFMTVLTLVNKYSSYGKKKK